MSEVYKFKAMSQVETLEEPTETTTVLAVEDGAVRQVPAAKLGGGGSGGYMVRAAIDVSNYSVTADKTYAEIVAAVEAGCAPVLYLAAMDGEFYLIPLVVAVEGTLLFQVYLDGAPVVVSCTAENVWAMPMD